jgi:DNA-binding transcriptional MocR family regulator
MNPGDIQLDAAGEGPVYRRIADQIRDGIEAGSLGAGSRLPPIRSLASDLGVNRDTVALAYESLADEGLVESVVGRGTFVRGTRPGVDGEERVDVVLASGVDRLLGLDNARPRFGATADLVPFHALIPDPAFYPVDDFRRAFNRAVSEGGADLFLYGEPQGYPPLREALATRFRAAGIDAASSDLVLCHGASQGISLALRLFAEPGDAVAVEAPTYHNVLHTLAGLGAQPVEVPMGDDGPDLAALERVLARPDVKAFYTIPTFHNPMGTTTSLAARRALLEVAARHGKPVIEDAFEMDLRCQGRAVASLAALDERGLVVHLFSFSKSLFPGARVGSILARGRALDGLIALKHATDLSDAMPLQAAMAEFLKSGAYDRHLGRIRRELRTRHAALSESLEREMPEGTRFTRPDGGYQVWVELPFDVDTRELLADAARAGVVFAPGSQFNADGRASRCLRLVIARTKEAQIRAGVEALGKAVRAHRLAAGSVRQPASVHL